LNDQLDFPPVFRFAPSPNGYLHLGHAASALINQRVAKNLGGRLLLRIEDIDVGRTREEFVDAIQADLEWLGIDFDGVMMRQSQCFANYQAAANRLQSMGLLYPCFATRSEINAAAGEKSLGQDPDGAPIYPGLHRGMDLAEVELRKKAGEPFAVRLDMAKAQALTTERFGGGITWQEWDGDRGIEVVEADPSDWGDVILQRKDVPTSYHLAVVVDDAHQGVTHVVRGADLKQATSIHRLLQILLELPEPVYHHHGLVRDAKGQKLSKSDASTSLRSLRASGVLRAEVVAKLGMDVLK